MWDIRTIPKNGLSEPIVKAQTGINAKPTWRKRNVEDDEESSEVENSSSDDELVDERKISGDDAYLELSSIAQAIDGLMKSNFIPYN